MKKIFFLSSVFILLLVSCTPQNNIDPNVLTELLNNNRFSFIATKANPTNSDILSVINAMPNGAASRILNLDYGYQVILKEKELEVTLPYFGRMYAPNFDSSKNNYRFTSKNFNVDKKQKKKGNWVYTFSLKDTENAKTLYLEIYPSGTAYLSIDSNDRQPISYDGYIMPNP